MDTTRRIAHPGARTDGDVLLAIDEDLRRGLTPPQVRGKLVNDPRFGEARVPSVKTISRRAKRIKLAPGDRWSLLNADPDEAREVFALFDEYRRAGMLYRMHWVRRDVVPTFLTVRAAAPELPAWIAYDTACEYHRRSAVESAVLWLDQFLVLAPWRGLEPTADDVGESVDWLSWRLDRAARLAAAVQESLGPLGEENARFIGYLGFMLPWDPDIHRFVQEWIDREIEREERRALGVPSSWTRSSSEWIDHVAREAAHPQDPAPDTADTSTRAPAREGPDHPGDGPAPGAADDQEPRNRVPAATTSPRRLRRMRWK